MSDEAQGGVHPTLVIKRAYLAMRRAIEEAVRPFGLSASQFDVIQQLLHSDGLEHGELQRRLAVASPSLTNVLDLMERDGWIERSAVPGNARVRKVSLTAKADGLRHKAGAFGIAGEQLEQRMFAGISDAERDLLLGLLARATANLGGIGAADVVRPNPRRRGQI